MLRVLICLALLAVAAFVVLEIVVLAGGRSELKQDPDVVLILGCKIWGEEPSPALERRLDAALDYLEELEGRGVEPLVLVSGGQGSDEPRSEAASMAEYLMNRGLPEDRIVQEDRSTSTATNCNIPGRCGSSWGMRIPM